METFILWVGFVGAWLLFAGPIYQAALELKDEALEIDRDSIQTVPQPKEVSVWWWLLPPIKIYLERKRSDVIRKAFVKTLSPEETESLLSFINKASAWLYVAIGGLFIAAKETYELSEHMHWSLVIFWALIIVLGFASIMNVIVRFKRSKRIIAQDY